MRRIVFAVILVLLVSWGCRKKSPVAPPTPAPPPPSVESAPPAVIPFPSEPAPLESAPLAKTIVSPSNLEVGDKNFRAGKYPQAIKAYEAVLKSNTGAKDREEALFRLGLSRALAGDSSRDMRQAEAAFKRLVTEFPGSRYKIQAEYILVLQAQIDKLRLDVKERDDRIKKLSEELQTLKEIDLQRKPSRPE